MPIKNCVRQPRICPVKASDPDLQLLVANWRTLCRPEKVKLMRRLQRRGASQRDLARLLGVNPSSVRHYLSAKRQQWERRDRKLRAKREAELRAWACGGSTHPQQKKQELRAAALDKLLEEFRSWAWNNELYPNFVFDLALEELKTHGIPPKSARPEPAWQNEPDFVRWLLGEMGNVTEDTGLIRENLERAARSTSSRRLQTA